MALTPRQENFIQNLIRGDTQRAAYKKAFKCPNMKDECIDVKACNLFKMDKIKLRYNELMVKVTENFVWSFERAQKELLELLNDSKSSRDRKHLLQAIKELNQISGIYNIKQAEEKPIQIEIKKVSDK